MKHGQRVLSFAIAVAVLISCSGSIMSLAQGQDAPAAKKAKPAKEKKNRKKARGRLPAYYGKLVDKAQREKIYGIQQQYRGKIAELRAQLAEMTKKRNAEIESVLTSDQKTALEKLRSEAKSKRKPRKKKGAAPSAEKSKK